MDTPRFRAFIERFALTLAAMGLQPMAARVLALLVCSDDLTLTPSDIGDRLEVSPAAVSGAIGLLSQAGLVERVAVPGSRRHHFRLAGDAWTGAGAVKQEVFASMAALAADGLDVVVPDGAAADRLAGMRDFYAFLAAEVPALLERWRAQRG